MNVVELISQKRAGEAHSREALAFLVDGITRKSIPDYQIAAWLMAVCWRGMTLAETTAFTDLVARSGKLLDLSAISKPKVDKHSTGGVGDKVTLVLAPWVAACGAAVAKLSGRGLGHTGGTVDKLEAIPGTRCDLTPAEFIRQVQEVGVAVAMQTPDLAPADGVLYALRDVTGTIQSVPLIAASVLSKKIAAGADVILLDVKYGAGAFMRDLPAARELATVMRDVGAALGKSVTVVLSAMDQPLGRAIGNALEVAEAVRTLRGEGPPDLVELCLELGAILLLNAGLDPTLDSARQRLREARAKGAALAKLKEMVAAQGGDATILDAPEGLLTATLQRPVVATESGYVTRLDALMVGQAVNALGGGRATKADVIDPAVGVVLHHKLGDVVTRGEALATIHANDPARAEAAEAALHAAYGFGPAPVAPAPLIEDVLMPLERISR